MALEPYDIVMLVVILGATVWGFSKGLAWQIASLAALVASYMVSLRFSEQLAPYLSATAPWNRFLAMLLLYMATSLVIWLAFRLVSGFIDRLKLREFDRQLGGVIGIGKGVLFCIVITFFAVTLSERAREKVLKSKSGHYIAEFIHKAEPIMPRELKDVLGPYLDQLNRELDPRTPPAAESDPGASPSAADPAGGLLERGLQKLRGPGR